VVLASGGYPGDFSKGLAITGIANAETDPDVAVFHAGTMLKDGALLTNGGRVLNVTARAESLPTAIDRAYTAVPKVSFEGLQYRTDIGRKALARLG
jgi:phosphoribosylamine--glycine ligase